MTDFLEKDESPASTAEPRKPSLRRWLRPVEFVLGPLNRQNAWVWLKLIVLILLLRWFFIEPFRIPSASMEPTLYGSMDFTNDDRVVVNKLAFGPRVPFTNIRLVEWGEPQRWDVVVFRSVEAPPAEASPLRKVLWDIWPRVLIKRVVGLPGERIEIRDGIVYANGKPLQTPPSMPEIYYTAQPPGASAGLTVVEVSPGHFQVVNPSQRMRYGVLPQQEYSVVPQGSYLVLGDNSGNSVDGRYFGWVPQGHILGRAFGIWWPLSRRRDLSGFTETGLGLLLLYGIPAATALYLFVTSFFVRSWPVHADVHELGLRRGDRILVNLLAFGLRVPFSRKRITGGRLPQRGATVLYRPSQQHEWDASLSVGRVVAVPGDSLACLAGDDAPGADLPGAVVPKASYCIKPAGENESVLDSVRREDVVGSVDAVWWPLGRRRTLAPRPASGTAEEIS